MPALSRMLEAKRSAFVRGAILGTGVVLIAMPLAAACEAVAADVRQSTVATDSASTPHDCVILIQKQRDDAYAAARASKQAFDSKAMLERQHTQAQICAARLNMASFIHPSELEDLGAIYLTAGDAPHARAAFGKAVLLLAPSKSARASGIVRVIRLYGNAVGVDSSHKDAEAFVSGLDSIPGVALQEVQAHGSLMGWYHDPKDEAVIDRHLQRVLELAPGLTVAEQKEADYQIMAGYRDVAMRQATALHVDSALATLQAIPSRFPGIPGARIKMWIAPAIEFYRQVGHPGHALNADYEINGKVASIAGGVSIISFTANWCAPCKLSYAPMEALLKRYGRRGLHEALAVELDGAFDGVKMTAAQEVEAQRHYFVDEHGVTFPIALQHNRRSARIHDDREPPAEAANVTMYRIRELPTFIVLDRHGIVRGALTDWDVNGRVEHSLMSLVEELLNDK